MVKLKGYRDEEMIIKSFQNENDVVEYMNDSDRYTYDSVILSGNFTSEQKQAILNIEELECDVEFK